MKKAICLMVIGEKYLKIFKKLEFQFLEYAKKCNAELKVFNNPLDDTFHRPLLSQKLLLPHFTQDYDIVTFLDIDILINPDSPSIFDYLPENKSFGAILDTRGTDEFNETWKHIPRILKETTQDYFTDRNFDKNDKLLGSINGGVFIFRPKEIAHLFFEHYFSEHNQGEHNSFEETPMAYITQVRDIFEPIPIQFNTQILYKLKGTAEGRKVFDEEKKIPKLLRKIFYRVGKNDFIPTKGYESFVRKLLSENYFLHFAGNFPIPTFKK